MSNTVENKKENNTADATIDEIFIQEVSHHVKAQHKFNKFISSATKAAGIMLLAAIVSLIVANSPAYPAFHEFWHTHIGFFVGEFTGEMSMVHVINDILMAIFFLLVGLEIKYEMTVGELTNIRQALLPIIAATGGVLVPIIIYISINFNSPETIHGWGVPMATDIAFALGIMALLGNKVPSGIRIFLSTLAVADDIIAILVIAIFYGKTPSMLWLGFSAAIMVVLVILNKRHIYGLTPYLALGVLLWYCVYMSGVHSTIAGVLLAFTIPSGSHINIRSFVSWSGRQAASAHEIYKPEVAIVSQKDYLGIVERLSNISRQVIPPSTRLEHRIYPWVYFLILPLFALTNADVSLVGTDITTVVATPEFLGVFFGLLLGKPIGIILFSFILVKSKLAPLPKNVNWGHVIGAGILGGVGFTMAIFVANLAFTDPSVITISKFAILAASMVAGVTGFLVLNVQASIASKKGISYVTSVREDVVPTTFEAEFAEEGRGVIEEMGSILVKEEIAALHQEGTLKTEVVLEVSKDNEK